MKRLLMCVIISLLVLWAASAASAQIPAYQVRYGGALPAVCNPLTGDVFYLNTAGPGLGLYQCVAAGGWIPVGARNTTALFAAGNGLVGAPAYAFAAEPTTGMYHVGAGEINFAVGGVNALNLRATGTASAYVILGPGGAVGAPTFSFTGDNTTGFYNTAAGAISIASSGVLGGSFDNDGWHPRQVLFAALGVRPAGTVVYCTDCTVANPCAGAGNGALATRIAAAWSCQ